MSGWRLGISTGVCIDLPIVDVLPAIRAAGATGVEIGTPPRHFDPRQAAEVAALDRALRAAGIEAPSIHAPFGGPLDLADPDPAHRDEAVDAALAAAMALKRVGGRMVVAHASDLPRHHGDISARLANAAESLVRLAYECAAIGMTLLVESPLPHLIGGQPEEFAELLKALPADAGVCLDTGHLALGGYWHRFLEVAGARLRHVHASDNRGQRDDHLPPGRGHIDWAEIARTLRAAGFDGWIMLELACPEAQPLDVYLRDAYAQAGQLLTP